MLRFAIPVYWNSMNDSYIEEVPEPPGCFAYGNFNEEAVSKVGPVMSKKPPERQMDFSKLKGWRRQSLQNRMVLINMDHLQRRRLPFDSEWLKNAKAVNREILQPKSRLKVQV